jgi:WD40 repeat protein
LEHASKVVQALTQSRGWPYLANVAAAAVPPKKRMTVAPPDAKDVPAKVYDEVLVAGADGQPRLYKLHREAKRVIGDDLNRVREYEKFPGRVYAVAFDRTGKHFAAGSSLDGAGEARVYETDSGKRVSTFEAVKTPVYAVAFRPDGKLVATAGFDGLVRLSDPATGKLVKEFVPVPGKPSR